MSRERDAVLGAREDSLRRIAALVAGGAASEDVFAAIAREVGYVVGVSLVVVFRYDPDGTTATVVGAWSEDPHPWQAGSRWPLDGPTILFRVLKTGRPARIDDFTGVPGTIADAARKTGLGAAAGAPIIVDGEVWGAMAANAGHGAVPDRMEERLAEFTELVATAISNAEGRVAVARLAEEQAALRRVATLVARGAPPEELFAAVVEEVGHVVGLPLVVLLRYDPDGTMATVIAAWGEDPHAFQTGTRWPLDGPTILFQVLKTGRPARIDDYAELAGTTADAARKSGFRASAGAPIIVDGEVWGAMAATSSRSPVPDRMEDRLAAFTELVATAISNTESRAGLARLAEEQAALRRVATLVARGAPPEEVFAAVANEVGRLLSADLANVCRYESDGTLTFVASASERFPVGSRWPLGGQRNLATLVSETGRPARLDDYADATGPLAEGIREDGIRSAVATPILVEGHLWGLMAAGSSQQQPLPPDTEARLASFTELVATTIANTEARTEVGRLVDEQTALRRVATLVAEGAAPSEVFAAVTEEVARLFLADLATMCRYESDGTYTIVAAAGTPFPLGSRWPRGGTNLATLVFETGRPARIERYAEASGPLADDVRAVGGRSAVGAPITVEDRLWGATGVVTSREQPLPADTEERLAAFMELVATAISNAEARTEVAASRARIVAATDEERRRVVRDLHDGAQQRLVHTIITLTHAQRAVDKEDEDAPALLSEALAHAQHAIDELRELAHGILPAILTHGGLDAGVEALASRMPVPVAIDVTVGRLPAAVEATAYFVVAEALTNVAKHARARHAEVTARIAEGTLAVRVHDDGVGGARPDGGASGSGLIGLADRLAAVDGQLRVESPVDGGTVIAADILVPGLAPPRQSRRAAP